MEESMKRIDDKRELDKHLNQNKRVMVLFCASWCPFCERFFPAFDKIVARNDFDEVLRVYLDDDDNPLWEDYSIESVPTVVLFDRGSVFRRLDGRLGEGLSEMQLLEWLKKAR